jgi:hypothetical protein
MALTKLAETSFTARVAREYSAVPTVDDLGTHTNTATLYQFGPSTFCVEWVVPAIDSVVQVGVWTDGTPAKKVLDYDGVFSLPVPIGAFLRAQGFDLSELYRSQPELRPEAEGVPVTPAPPADGDL